MKGATAEDSEKTRRTPTRSRNTKIGSSHIFFRTLKNSRSSTTMPLLPIVSTSSHQYGDIIVLMKRATKPQSTKMGKMLNDPLFRVMARILGFSAYYHDSAICPLEESRIVAALQEERFSRLKPL